MVSDFLKSLALKEINFEQFTALCSNIWTLQEEKLEILLQEEPLDCCSDLSKAAMRYQLLNPGKRIRSAIPLLVISQLYSDGEDDVPSAVVDAALWFGLAVEIAHSATLIHDDIIDGDRFRRQKLSIWAKYGRDQAIAVGDILFFLGQEALHRPTILGERRLQALQRYSLALRRVAYGQGLEIDFSQDHRLPKRNDWYAIALGKTGGLISLALVLGGLLGERGSEELEALNQMGESLGVCFQLRDDLLEFIGDKDGRSRESDLWEGKPTWLVAHCAEHNSEDGARELTHLLRQTRQDRSRESLRRIRQLMINSKSLEAGVVELGHIAGKTRRQANRHMPKIMLLLNFLLDSFTKIDLKL